MSYGTTKLLFAEEFFLLERPNRPITEIVNDLLECINKDPDRILDEDTYYHIMTFLEKADPKSNMGAIYSIYVRYKDELMRFYSDFWYVVSLESDGFIKVQILSQFHGSVSEHILSIYPNESIDSIINRVKSHIRDMVWRSRNYYVAFASEVLLAVKPLYRKLRELEDKVRFRDD